MTDLARDVMANINLLVVEQHAIDRLDGVIGGFSSFIMDETITLGAAMFIGGDLAGQNITKSRKRVVKCL